MALARRRAMIVELRMADSMLSFTKIAELVEEAGLAGPRYSRMSCQRDWKLALQAFMSEESVKRQRALINMRYARLVRALWPKAIQGDTKAVDSLVKLMAEQARLNGLLAPQRSQLEISMHITQLAEISVAAVSVGMDAADLPPEARQLMLDAMRRHFHDLQGQADVVELEALDDAG